MMFDHAPSDYDCPMCNVTAGIFSKYNAPSDVVAQSPEAFALVSPKWWPNNPGSALVVPRTHVENIYSLPPEAGTPLWSMVQRVAVAMRIAYVCDGITVRQHNEPAGHQDLWHIHVHVIPRYDGDRLYKLNDSAVWHREEERQPYADLLRAHLIEIE